MPPVPRCPRGRGQRAAAGRRDGGTGTRSARDAPARSLVEPSSPRHSPTLTGTPTQRCHGQQGRRGHTGASLRGRGRAPRTSPAIRSAPPECRGGFREGRYAWRGSNVFLMLVMILSRSPSAPHPPFLLLRLRPHGQRKQTKPRSLWSRTGPSAGKLTDVETFSFDENVLFCDTRRQTTSSYARVYSITNLCACEWMCERAHE